MQNTVTTKEEPIADVYARTTETINRALRSKTATLSSWDIPQSVWRKPLLIYLLAPICGALLSLAVATLLSWNPSLTWIAVLVGELLAVNLSTFRIAFDLFIQKKNSILYLFWTSVVVVIAFSPWSISQIVFSTLPSRSQSALPIFFTIDIVIAYFALSFSTAMLTSMIETLKITFSDFASTYRTTIGRSANRAVAVALRVVLQTTHNGEDAKELEYLRVAAQAMIDSSGTRILPWLALLTIVSIGFDSVIKKTLASSMSLLSPDMINVGVPVVRFGVAVTVMYLTFTVAHRTYIDVVILQAVCRIQQKLKM